MRPLIRCLIALLAVSEGGCVTDNPDRILDGAGAVRDLAASGGRDLAGADSAGTQPADDAAWEPPTDADATADLGSCGGAGQSCCGHGGCSAPGTACLAGTCVACGGIGQPCCATASCGMDLQCVGGVCGVATSCQALLLGGQKQSGAYLIDPDGAGPIVAFTAYCDMESDGGGWVLAGKIDGTKQTFLYGAAAWTDGKLFGAPDLSATEAKLAPWITVPLGTLRLVMRDGGKDRAVTLAPPNLPPGTTLDRVFGGAFIPTRLERPAWLGLLANGSLQTHCGQEGFNNRVGGQNQQNLRLGIFGNQENDCSSCDSLIGIGHDVSASANLAAGPWDDSGAGGRATSTFSFLWLR